MYMIQNKEVNIDRTDIKGDNFTECPQSQCGNGGHF